MDGVYIFIIIIVTFWGMYYLLDPFVKCYYKCFPRDHEQTIEV